MKTYYKILLLPLFFLCLQNIHSFDFQLTEANVEATLGGNYTRGSHFLGEIAGIGTVEFDNLLGFTAGFSIGRTLVDTDINAFAGVRYTPFKTLPISFSLKYIYNGFPEYEAHTSSIIPYVSYDARIAGVSLGMNFRFSSHFFEEAQFETVLSFYGYFNFINNDRILIGIGAGNLKEFHANNMGGISLNVYAQIPVADNLSIVSDIEYMQSGMDGLTATLYKMAFKTGVKISW